ncbi:MAG: putative membrane-bound dehydrogenase-like protein [Saprospiraceae bacterium]|jgi:putative membrane-bound dehydrogenase-like protein
MKIKFYLIALFFCQMACNSSEKQQESISDSTSDVFTIVQEGDELRIQSTGNERALVTQNAQANHRPYLHPILAPNSDAALTEYSPGHHTHQTGLYWGFTRVNGSGTDEATLKKWFYDKNKSEDIQSQIGRDFFHNPGEGFWQRVSTDIIKEEGAEVVWQTIYNMLDESKTPILEESQTWTFTEKDGKHLLTLEWEGKALVDITVNEFSYGGLFLRMPWKEGIHGEAVNAARQRNEKAEGQRAMWVDVGMEIDGLTDWGHIAIFDHPNNSSFPQPWRVDGQLGIGPVLAKMGDWSIKKGEAKVFQHQLVAYSGKMDDTVLNDLWGDFAGDKGMYNTAALWNIARQEGKDAKLLSPIEAVEAMTIKEGYEVNAFASEPMITQPMAFCWDNKGRMWIAENRDYESRQSGFSGSGDSRILILEDTDRDGVADKKKVFMEGIPFPSAIAVGHGGVFVGAPPNLLFVPDSNEDDIADESAIKVLLTGWGIRDRHETINSLHWGPDGWLYGLEGFATPSKIRKPKPGEGRLYKHRDEFPADLLEADGVDVNGGVWRYHPLKDRFEVVAHGFSNPWGIDYDAKGQLFISACVIPHMFHIIQGGIYHRQGGQHFNPYVYEDIKTIVDHRHRSAHGGARIYQSDAFDAEQQGRLFMANIHEHAVLSDIIKINGSGFTASHGEDFMLANNAQWIGFSMEVGPEGGLYVLDWHDAEICGQAVDNKETGRVFRMMPQKSKADNWPGRYDDLNNFDDAALVELQLSKSNWHAQRARVILQYRASKASLSNDAIARLNALLDKNENEDLRLRALWTLHIANIIEKDKLIALLTDSDEYIRAWAIQFLVEDKIASTKAIERMTKLSQNESSAVVRRYLAEALQRLPNKDRWELASELVQRTEDIDDPNIPLMLWFGIEPLAVENPNQLLELAHKSKIPSITQKIARRLVDGNQLELLTAALEKRSNVQKHLMQGMVAGMEGNADLKEPAKWASIYKKLKSNMELAPLADEIAQHFGSAEIAKKYIAIINTPSSSLQEKNDAIRALALQQNPLLEEELPTLLDNKNLRLESIKAVAAYENRRLGQILKEKYTNLTKVEKEEVIMTMASRPLYGTILADGLKNGTISKFDIPAHVVLQLRAVLGNGFVEIWGPIDDISKTLQVAYKKYQHLATDEAIADASTTNGRSIFLRACGVCHQLHGEGGEIGPDLTGSNRTNTGYLLSNILNPSGDLQDDYKLVVVTTQDGRTYSGNIIGESEKSITLRIVGQDPIVISKSQIRTRDVSEKSMMPEGILNTLTDEEVLDLFAYLKKLETPKEL